MNKPITLFKIFRRIIGELKNANKKYPKFSSPHEALGVIREEYIEFELEVMKYKIGQPQSAMFGELIQLAAMSVKAMLSFWGDPEYPIHCTDETDKV